LDHSDAALIKRQYEQHQSLQSLNLSKNSSEPNLKKPAPKGVSTSGEFQVRSVSNDNINHSSSKGSSALNSNNNNKEQNPNTNSNNLNHHPPNNNQNIGNKSTNNNTGNAPPTTRSANPKVSGETLRKKPLPIPPRDDSISHSFPHFSHFSLSLESNRIESNRIE
jgi:hypothetical protein